MELYWINDVLEARAVYKELRALGVRHPVIRELELNTYRGATACVVRSGLGTPLSVHSSKIGKRRSNVYEPYMNWYIAFTLPEYRRGGLATILYRAVEAKAEASGCRRVKSLAGSAEGAWLHYSLGHKMWGAIETGELIVDSALPGSVGLYTGAKDAPAQTKRVQEKPMTKVELTIALRNGLRYDKV